MKTKKIVAVILSLFLVLLTIVNLFSIKNLFVRELICYDIKPENEEDEDELGDGSSDNSMSDMYIKEYDTFLEGYYSNLTQNMGENYKGSCGYVSIGMVLSYYDTYLSDDIIPEKYDVISDGLYPAMVMRESPGILHDTIFGGFYKTNQEYLNIITSKANDSSRPSLHAKLITIGADLGYYNYDSDMPCGTTMSQQENVMLKYLKEQGYTENSDFTITTYYGSSDEVKKYVKENIDAGYPVMINVFNSQGKGHSCVAYDYVDDEIYANMGWCNSTTYAHYKVSKRYSVFESAMVLKFNKEHTHSYNYSVGSGSNVKYYCYDNCDIVTYKIKKHNYISNITYINESFHQAYCETCGAMIEVAHTYTDHYEIGSTAHFGYCACGIHIEEEHNYTNHYDIELSEHTGYCVCGASKVELHNYIDHYEKADSEYHYAYCECGEKIDEKHYWNKDPDNSGIYSVVRCKYCLFSKRLKPGEFIPIIIGRHEEEFEES